MSDATTQGASSIKALTCHVQIVGVRAKVDGSLGVSLATPELTATEKAVFMDWMNRDLVMMLQADTAGIGDVKEVKGEFDRKTPSQRLRDVLFVWWKQVESARSFDDFYLEHMNKMIDHVKTKLEPR
jgi:hypothetical protein